MISENTPTLETPRLILRKLTRSASDMNAMFAILSDEKTNIFLPWFPLTRMEEVQKHVQERYFDFYDDEVYCNNLAKSHEDPVRCVLAF